MNCPRCGSPVMLTGTRWECGWCLDSGWLSVKPAPVRIELRFVCRVDLDEAWKDLRAELDQLVPGRAEALAPALAHAAVYQLSLSAPPENGETDPRIVRDLRGFLDAAKALGTPDGAAARIERGERLFEDEGALTAGRLGSFWQSLLDALEAAGALPWETDTDRFFHTLALFRSWRRGGPGNDPDYLDGCHALQDAFHARWEALCSR